MLTTSCEHVLADLVCFADVVAIGTAQPPRGLDLTRIWAIGFVVEMAVAIARVQLPRHQGFELEALLLAAATPLSAGSGAGRLRRCPG